MVAAITGVGALLLFATFASDGRWSALGGDVVAAGHVERSARLVATTAGGALAMAASALWLALSRGRSMLGRPRACLLYGVVLIPIGLFAWKIAASMAFGDPMLEWPDRPGLRCLSLSLLVAIGPLLSLLAMRRSAPARPALNGAAIGIAAGAGAWFAVDLWCPVAYVPHLLLGHLLPLSILAGVGALLGRALLSPGWRPLART
jgi:hypothetical protein